MTFDVHRALEEAAGPGEDRPFRHTTYDAIARGQWYRRRRTVFAAGGGMAAAAVVIAAGAVLPFGDNDSSRDPAGPPQMHTPGGPDGRTVPLGLGPLDDQQAQSILSHCGAARGDYAVDMAQRFDYLHSPIGVVVLSFESGRIVECLGATNARGEYNPKIGVEWSVVHDPVLGEDPPAPPDADHPLRRFKPLEFGYRQPRLSSEWDTNGLFLAADSVDRVEVRVGTPDGPAPWRAANVHDGLVFWATWFEKGTYDANDRVWVEWRAYDTDGNLLDPALMPLQPRKVSSLLR